jgi:hypothetical protein
MKIHQLDEELLEGGHIMRLSSIRHHFRCDGLISEFAVFVEVELLQNMTLITEMFLMYSSILLHLSYLFLVSCFPLYMQLSS